MSRTGIGIQSYADERSEHAMPQPGANHVAFREPERDTRESVLAKYFSDRSPRLLKIYVGACRVMRDSGNPDRHSLAAYGFRELMDKVFEDLQIQAPSKSQNLTSTVHDLKREWDKLGFKTITISTTDALDAVQVRHFLERCDVFFARFEEQRPKRFSRVGEALVAMDGMKQKLLPQLHDNKVEMWMGLYDYFNKILHHNAEPDVAKFVSCVEAMETVLLNSFYPATGADLDEIDALLKGQ